MNERLNVLHRCALVTRTAIRQQQDSAYRGPATANGQNGAEERQGRVSGQRQRAARGVYGAAERGSWDVRVWRDGKVNCAPLLGRWRSMSGLLWAGMGVYTVVFVPVCKKVQPYTILHMGLGAPYRALERPR
jgi:hypothetical protein